MMPPVRGEPSRTMNVVFTLFVVPNDSCNLGCHSERSEESDSMRIMPGAILADSTEALTNCFPRYDFIRTCGSHALALEGRERLRKSRRRSSAPRLRFEQSAAARAFTKNLAGIGRHWRKFGVAAVRTGQCAFKNRLHDPSCLFEKFFDLFTQGLFALRPGVAVDDHSVL